MATFDEFQEGLYELFSQGHLTEAQYLELRVKYLKSYNQLGGQADEAFLNLQKTQDEIHRYEQSHDIYD